VSGAVFGLVGVFVGAVLTALLTWTREVLADRRTRGRAARYLAIRVVCILDKYVERCAEVVSDQGEPDEQGCLAPQVSSPPPPEFPPDLDWRSIDHALMYRLLSMPNEAEAAASSVAAITEYVAGPPDYAEYFEERQVQYAKLGLAAFVLTEELRKTYGIPALEFGAWNPVDRLNKARKEVEEERRKRQEHFSASASLLTS